MNKFWKIYWPVMLVVSVVDCVIYYTDETLQHQVSYTTAVIFMALGILFEKASRDVRS